MRRQILLLILLGLVIGAALSAYLGKSASGRPQVVGFAAVAGGGETVSGATAQVAGVPEDPLAPVGGAAGSPASERLVRFRAWREKEAASLDSIKVEERAHQQNIEATVKSFTPVEWEEVLRSLLDLEGAANERILSAYLLGLGGFDFIEGVEKILDQRLPEGPTQPHSVEETRNMREKSLRVLVIEELIQQAKKDPSKRELLAQTIRRIDDPYLRDLANRRMKEEGLL